MARLDTSRLLLAVALAGLLVSASAQFGGKKEKPKSPARKEDIKYIKCQVCEAMAKQAGVVYREVTEEAGPKKVSEGDILDRLEKMCDPDQDDGDWISRHDIVEQDTSLVVKDTGAIGRCKTECRTIARACEQLAEDLDLTDLSAMLYKGQKRAAVTNWMCYDATDVCVKKPPPVPKDRPAGEAHEAMDPDEHKTVQMMRNMKAQGLSGTMYNRDTLQEELAELQTEYGEDEDFQKVMKDTGMDAHVKQPSAGAASQQPSSGAGAGAGSGGSGGGASEGVGAKVGQLLQGLKAKAAEVGARASEQLGETAKGFSAWVKERVAGVGKKAGAKEGAEL